MKSVLSIALFLVSSSVLLAQTNLIKFSDERGKIIQIDPSTLNHISVKAVGHDNKEHTYSGVLLSDIISHASALLGEGAKRQTVSRYVVLKAKDNYQCVYALAEIDPLFASSKIIVADKMNARPLSSENGPFQVIAPSDKKHGRWIRQLVSIEVRTVK